MTQSFNSLEEMLAYMREQSAAASAATPPQLREMVTWGSHVICPRPDIGVMIFGRISTLDEMRTTEDEGTLADLERAHAADRRYGWWYSVIEPSGEPGSHHVVDLYPISAEQFGQAHSVDWNPKRCPWLREVLVRAAALHDGQAD